MNVDTYILKFSPETQRRLEIIRDVVFAIFPNAEEMVYYGMPTVSSNGKYVLGYAAYKNHISLIIGTGLSHFLKTQYPQYQYTPHTIKFPHSEGFPEALIKEICELINSN